MPAVYALNDGYCDPVEHNQAFLTVLYSFLRDQENKGAESRYFGLPFPAKSTDFLLAAPGVDLEQRHLGEMSRQLPKKPRPLIPARAHHFAERVGDLLSKTDTRNSKEIVALKLTDVDKTIRTLGHQAALTLVRDFA